MGNQTKLAALRESRQSDSAPKRTDILVAVLRLLTRSGYRELTMEDLAHEAGVNKTTLYRWWSGKPAVVADAIASLMSVGPIPETDSVRDDLVAITKVTIRNYGQSALGAAIPALISDLTTDPAGLAEFRRSFVEARRKAVGPVFDRAKASGQLAADADTEIIMDMVAGAIFYRMLATGEKVDSAMAEGMVDILLH